jgi:uncharacterized membrane protein YhiD involved in acid resistance
MPEWLRDSFQHDADVPPSLLAVRLAVGLALGCVVAGIYRLTHGKGRGEGNGLTATLVLLTVLIGMVTLVIGNSVARAFSLVGALAIVRFRTVVEDTRDTAFVIFAVAVGMAVGAGFLTVALMGLPFAAAAAFLFRPRPGDAGGPREQLLTLRVGLGNDPEALARETFAKHLEGWRLLATATARQGAALDLTYAVALRSPGAAVGLVAELTRLEGVQSVELRQA